MVHASLSTHVPTLTCPPSRAHVAKLTPPSLHLHFDTQTSCGPPVGLGCVMLTLMPNLPKPTELLSLRARVGRTWSVLATREMLLLAPVSPLEPIHRPAQLSPCSAASFVLALADR